MAVLTKLILNNKIVEFRKWVRQSRIHCIRKLTRDVKKLREKKGTEEQKTKNQKKAGRYVEEIFIMKKMKDDEISKFALLNEKTLNDITNDINESLDKKALARLVHHKAVAEKVQNFREMFPDWKNCLPLLLETLGEKYKHKKSNSGKKSEKKKSRTLKIVDNSGTWLVEPITRKRSTVVNVEGNPINEQPHHSIQRSNGTSKRETNEERLEKLIDDEHKRSTGNVENTNEERPEKFIDENTIRKKPIVQDITEKNSAVNDSDEDFSEKCSPREMSAIEGTIDPFFLTKDNVEYVSISTKSNTSNPEEIKPKLRNQQEFNNDRSFKKREFKPYQHNGRESYDQRINRRESQLSNFGKRESSRNNRNYRRNEMLAEPPPTLHPSWEAKKKQSQLVHFEGKKVKFDDS